MSLFSKVPLPLAPTKLSSSWPLQMQSCSLSARVPLVRPQGRIRTAHRQIILASSTPDIIVSAVATHSQVSSLDAIDTPVSVASRKTVVYSESIPALDNGSGGSALPPEGPGGKGDGDGGEPSPSSFPHPLSFLLCGLRGRLAADPFFTQKLLVECGLDAAIIIGVNFAARRERFLAELEFTCCQLAISLLSDFALVYLLAPSTFRSAAKAGSLRAKLETLPAHIFQKSPLNAAPYPLRARFATFLLKGVQYGGVGFLMGCLGAASVQGLIWLRERVDPDFSPPSSVQSIRGTGMAWSAFMSSSSNVRYNLVNAIEDACYSQSAKAGTLASVVLRLGNNYAGAAQWVAVTNIVNLDVPWKSARSTTVGKKEQGGR